MAKDETPRKGKSGAPPRAEDSLDFTDPGPGKPAAAPRRKKAASADLTKSARSRSLGVPVLVAAAIVVVVVFLMADRSSKEVVTKAPPGKPASPAQKSPTAPRPPQTAAPAPSAPAFPTPQTAAPAPQPSASAGGHRRAIPAEFRKALVDYASRTGGKAIALALDAEGRYAYGSVSGFATHEEAIKEALSDCERYKGSAGVQERCKLYAVGDKIVWQ